MGGMLWTVLYIAFGVVALWLLGEVLLQYKARLRWRLLAFSGFMGVVLGVVLPSMALIALGTVSFVAGQVLVTLSFRKGFSTGWALGGMPGTSRRRRREMRPMAPLEDDGSDGSDGSDAADAREAQDAPQAPEPPAERPDDAYDPSGTGYDTGGHPVTGPHYAPYDGAAYPGGYEGGYDPGGYDTGGYPAPAQGYPQQDYTAAYAQHGGTADHGYAAYSDPYIGGAGGGTEPYPEYGTSAAYAGQPDGQGTGYDTPGYDTSGAAQWAATGGGYYQETPPGGVWVPQQRDNAAPDDSHPPQESTGYPGYYPGEQRY